MHLIPKKYASQHMLCMQEAILIWHIMCVRWKMVDHYVSRVCGSMQLLQQRDIIGRTSELARLFGIQFYHVLTRGSQVQPDTFLRRCPSGVSVALVCVSWTVGTSMPILVVFGGDRACWLGSKRTRSDWLSGLSKSKVSKEHTQPCGDTSWSYWLKCCFTGGYFLEGSGGVS